MGNRLVVAASVATLTKPVLLQAQSARDSVALGRAIAAELARGDTVRIRPGAPAAPNMVTEAFARALGTASKARTVATITSVRLGRDTARVGLSVSSQSEGQASEGEGEYRAVCRHGRWRVAIVLPWREAHGEIIPADSSKRRAP